MIKNGRMEGIVSKPDPDDTVISYGDKVIMPGFIDIHIHGWASGSFAYEGTEESLENMSRELVKEGVTSYLATTTADSVDNLVFRLNNSRKYIKRWTPEMGAEVIGIHMEGPFINKKYKGMQKEENFLNPSIEILDRFINTAGKGYIKLITIAPELPGAKEFIQYSNKLGIQISVGHSAAEFEDIKNLKEYGIGGFTHMYSAMSGFHHRRLGCVGAALYFDDMYVEFAKQTGLTVAPEAFKIAYKIKGPQKIILVTDCVGLACVQEPRYHYIRKCTFVPIEGGIKLVYDDGREDIIHKNEYEKLRNLELSFLGSVKNVVKNVNASIADIVTMACENPAKYIGVYDRKGSIEKGKDADLLIIDEKWNIVDVYINGRKQKL